MQRDIDVVPLGAQEGTTQGTFRVGEGDCMDDTVELVHTKIVEHRRQGRQLIGIGDVELDDVWFDVESAHCPSGGADGPLQIGDDDPGTLLLGELGGAERDGGGHRHTGDEDGASVKESHEHSFQRIVIVNCWPQS